MLEPASKLSPAAIGSQASQGLRPERGTRAATAPEAPLPGPVEGRRRPADVNARLLNVLLYQAGWFACVLGAVSLGMPPLPGYAAIAVGWAIALPALAALAGQAPGAYRISRSGDDPDHALQPRGRANADPR